MRTVTDAFISALEKSKDEVLREVSFKRRYWKQSDSAYVWESGWTTLAQNEVINISPITGQLDTERLNEFQLSNVTLILRNNDNRWRADNPSGKFGQDESVSLFPFEPYFTKFRVRVAVRLPDGTDEYVTLFTGLAVDYVSASNNQVQVQVQGLESLLVNANAENVSTQVLNENAGTGNAINKAFTTVNPGVGIIEEVSVDGVTKTPGTDYNVSDLDEPTAGATVTFEVAPGVGEVVRISYRYWKQNQKIEDLVGDLLTEAGIAAGNQNVDPVIFSNPIKNAIVIDSMADWVSGTLTAVDASSSPGSIKIDPFDTQNYELLDDFSDGNYTANPVWTTGGNLSWSVPSNRLRYDKGGVTNKGVIHTTHNGAQVGLWKWTCNGIDTSYDRVVFAWGGSGQIYDTTYPFYPYSFYGNKLLVQSPPYSSSGHTRWYLYVKDVLIGEADYDVSPSADITIKITRDVAGNTKVYVDDVLIISAQSTGVVATAYFGIGSEQGAFSLTDRQMDDFYQPKVVMTGTWSSPTHDLSIGVVNLGKLTSEKHVGDGAINIYTRTSADGISWDSWIGVAANGQMQSTVRRYLQVKVEFSVQSSSYDPPYVDSIRAEYQSETAVITLAKFTGKTVYDAIQDLGKFANYEWGFTADEDFFFRSKVPKTGEDADILRSRDISQITGLVNGYDRVYNKVKVTYGNFSATLKTPGNNPVDPGARFKERTLEIDGGDIIIGVDADVASGIARFFFEEFSRPKKRFKALCKFLPHVELSDVLFVEFDQNAPRPTHYAGDTSHYAGEPGLLAFGPSDQIVSDIRAKVIGFRHDLHQNKSEFDLQEVI